MDTVQSSCPDPESLAAWLDQGVDAAEREQIEAHLATCDDCRLVMVRVLETQSAVHEAPAATTAASAAEPMRVAHFPRTKTMWGVASVLAAAAVLTLSFNAPLQWWPWSAGGTGSKLADLAAAAGDERTVEARLTGGFSYGPLRAAVRSGGSSAASDNWTLLAAAGKIRDDAAREPTAANLHALGLAHLVIGEYDPAVRALEDAIAEAPQHARYHSDLAAAYLARARHLDRPEDFPRALDAVERALKANDTLLEARFNRALALEALFLNDQARAAWEDYLSFDAGSGWAAEARAHLQKLQQTPSPGELARNNSPPLITDTSVEAALDWLLRQGLPQWADAILANDVDRAAREHVHLTEYATQIGTISGDGFARALVEKGARTPLDRAQALRRFASALQAFDADDIPAAETAFATACAEVDVPLAVLCAFHLGSIDVLQRREADAERRAAAALQTAAERHWIYPANLAKRLTGYRLLFRGDYATTSGPYGDAFEGFHRAKYLGAACNLATQLADLADVVGLPTEGWRWRHRALALAARIDLPACTYLTRVQTAGALVAQGQNAGAAAVIATIDGALAADLPDVRRAIFDITKARIAMAADDATQARASLKDAHDTIRQSKDFRARRLIADLLAVEAALEQRENQFDSAHSSLTAALESMGPERMASRATVLLTRASLTAATIQSQMDSERDVHAAIALLKARISNPGQQLRLEEAETAFKAIAVLVKREVLLQGSRGMLLVEHLRQLLNSAPPQALLVTERDIQAALSQLPPGAVVVSYLLASDSVVAWVLTRSGIQFTERPVRPESVRTLLNTLSIQVNRTPGREELWRATLAELYDALLKDLPSVEHASELAIIPDGILGRVPFGALFDARAKQHLFERATVRAAPNLAFAMTAPDAPRTIASGPLTAAVVGDPRLSGSAASVFKRLPRAGAEARAVAGLYPMATVMLGDDATKARVLRALERADIVHYAGHAVASPDVRGARLLLAGDVSDSRTALSGSDLAGRLTRPMHVVLAACETGVMSVDRATGLTSLSTAFLRAGAGSVIATLWPVDDTASEMFFLSVHRELAAGQSSAVAVARAQRACRANLECRRAAATWVGTTVYGSD